MAADTSKHIDNYYLPLVPSETPQALSTNDEKILANLPPILSQHLARLYITGLVSSVESMSQYLRHFFNLSLPDAVVAHIVNLHAPEWIQQRAEYMQRYHDRFLREHVRLEKSPIDERHYNLLTKLEVITGIKTDDMMSRASAGVDIDTDELTKLSTTAVKLAQAIKTIPSLEEVRARARDGDKGIAYSEKYELVLTKVLEFGKQSNVREIEATVKDLEEGTQEVIESERREE
jgi:hypothetical protein